MLGPYIHRIDPIIADAWGVHLWWYGLSYTLGFLEIHLFLARARRRIGLSVSEVYSLSLMFMVGVLLGGRLIEVAFDEWPFYREHFWLIPAYWLGGMATHGLLLGAAASIALFSLLYKKPFREIADELVIPGAFLMGLGRIGNFIDGQIVGRVTDVWWAVKFPDAEGFRHPVVLYDGVKNLLLIPLLLWIGSRPRRVPGEVAAHFVFWYAFLRIFVDLFRDYPTHRLAIGTGMSLNLVMSLVGVVLLVRVALKKRRLRPGAPVERAPAPTAAPTPLRLALKRAALAFVLVFSLAIPSNWTQDVPARYGKRHPGLHHSFVYPQIDTAAPAPSALGGFGSKMAPPERPTLAERPRHRTRQEEADMRSLVPLLLLVMLTVPAQPGRFDVLIRHGHVIDGTGNPWFPADVGVSDGRVRAVARRLDAPANVVIDATGLVVTPGFIDMHTHSESTLLRDGDAQSKIRQGVTLEVVGEGGSPAPRRAEKAETDPDLARAGITEGWTTFREYFDLVNRRGIALNLMSYVAAGQLRRVVIGEDFRKPSPAELDRMKTLARQAMADGVLGLVAALEMPAGAHPDAAPGTEELIELARAVGESGGIFGTHMRNQTDHFIDSIRETGEIAERAGVRAEIFHIKSAGRPYFGQMKRAMDEIRAFRARGVDVGADIYPYIAAAHGLATEVPRWAQDGGRAKFLERLKDPALRPRLKQETDAYIQMKYYNEEKRVGGYDAVMISSTQREKDPNVGKTIAQIAKERGVSGADAVLDLLVENRGNVGIVMYYMSEADMRIGLADPYVAICSDGSSMSAAFGGQPHPRSYGTFPRILGKYVRDERLLPLEEAVRKMTSLAAQRLGLQDRGLVREGHWADIVIFDPARVADRATFENPHQYPQGIEYVLVNGQVVIRKGEHTGARPGRVIYGPGRAETTRPADLWFQRPVPSRWHRPSGL